MQAEQGKPSAAADRRLSTRAVDERRELELLAEFMRHNSVASLAREIADRSGGSVQDEDLIAAAGLNSPLTKSSSG